MTHEAVLGLPDILKFPAKTISSVTRLARYAPGARHTIALVSMKPKSYRSGRKKLASSFYPQNPRFLRCHCQKFMSSDSILSHPEAKCLPSKLSICLNNLNCLASRLKCLRTTEYPNINLPLCQQRIFTLSVPRTLDS
jgi:hypothetical protein